MIPRETLHELAFLRRRVDDLEAEIETLKGQHEDGLKALREGFGVTAGEARLLAALAQGGIRSREQILASACEPDTDNIRQADSMVKRVRMRVPALTILTHYGFGYELDDESLLKVRKVMRGQA